MTMPTCAPLKPVMKALRTLITQRSRSQRADVFSIDGSEPAPSSAAGSVMRNAERARPEMIGAKKRAFCACVATLPSKNMLPSSGAMVLQAKGPRGESPVFLSTVAVAR